MTFGERLSSARVRVGLSQKAAAEKTGCHAVTWNKWEHDKAPPPVAYATIRRMSEVLDVSFAWLAEGVGPMTARKRTVKP